MGDAEEQTSITKLQVHKWRRRLKEPEKYRAMLFGAAYHKAMAEPNTTAAKWIGDPESYTPTKYIEAARTAVTEDHFTRGKVKAPGRRHPPLHSENPMTDRTRGLLRGGCF